METDPKNPENPRPPDVPEPDIDDVIEKGAGGKNDMNK
jgi:hypothetical protein